MYASGNKGSRLSLVEEVEPDRRRIQTSLGLAPASALGLSEARPIVRILIADDHQLLRQGYCALLAREQDFQVVAEARDGAEAVEMVRSRRPDIVLMDIQMPRMDGLQAIEEIGKFDQAGVLVVSMICEAATIQQALLKGAKGFISKDDSFDELTIAIRSVHKGQEYLGKRVRAALAGQGQE